MDEYGEDMGGFGEMSSDFGIVDDVGAFEAIAEADFSDPLASLSEDTAPLSTVDPLSGLDSGFSSDAGADPLSGIGRGTTGGLLPSEATKGVVEPLSGPRAALHEYMCEHNFGKDDFITYSHDPKWHRLTETAHPEVRETLCEMRDYQNTIGGINPNYSLGNPWNSNCGSCALATDSRLSGIDPGATASPTCIPGVREMDAATGKSQTTMSPDKIAEYARSQGSGFRAIVGYDRATGAGHWVNIAVSDSGIVWTLDSQPDPGLVQTFEEHVKAERDACNWDISI